MTEPPSCDIMRCETLARRLLPRMRAEMVYRLVSERGISQSEVSKRLGISRAAVSQYMSRKRGFTRQDFPGELNLVIERWVSAVASGEGTITICDVCRSADRAGNR
ncbi:helix-turn-helix domain-containing protein [Methanoculleus bourgensis]|jgi:predicted transcriptional regulator|uniref:Helix-turn-helix domain-containing protein n=2 Tax=Methanoculleus bourgensis TaxID=83986 RepID=A0A0X8XYH7_9EURY|nr:MULTISPECIES: helix-turn-helix domain-containing protein [Methanoculleus]MBT0732661.1 helix-turn-helix domain-containing protein [Methanoculleus bourgensis]MDD3372279.1 helix-turn-helix domain-containing protein [Methanoculleus bourgensis]NMA88647.1 helix-turn-helix domain-containing protein [Methanoculleus bourgensis]NQS78748.1 helix-turn-helix domain-containing protein [Methanoculleus bourgensis]CCJ37492.1 transcriptional regulator, Fis family [Methanoculleus bourgensis MS2]